MPEPEIPAIPPPLNAQLIRLIEEFAALAGIRPDDSSDLLGLEFRTGTETVRIYPCGTENSLFFLDVCAGPVEVDSTNFATLVQFHRLNDARRWINGWMVTIDEEDNLIVSRRLRAEDLAGADLAAAVAEGLDLAATCRTEWTSAEDPHSSTPVTQAAP
jgi:hypothetical protein